MSSLLRAAAPVAELSVGACTSGRDADSVSAVFQLLAMPQVVLVQICIQGCEHTAEEEQMQRVCTVLRTHARTLRSVKISGYELVRTPHSLTALLDTLCTCNKLVYLELDFNTMNDRHLDGTRAFTAVADALRAAGTLRHLVLRGRIEQLFSVGAGAVAGATIASVLLPAGLMQLEIEGANWRQMSNACKSALARALRHNTMLRALKLHHVIDMPVPADNEGEDKDEEGYDDPQRLLPLRVALATTQLQRLDVMTGPCGLCSVAALTASGALPASLQELCLFDHSDDPVWAAELPLLFTAVHRMPALRSLMLLRDQECPLGIEAAHACARMLLHPAAAPPRLRHFSISMSTERMPEECATMAAELCGNVTLTSLHLSDIAPATLRAFGGMLAHNTGLRELSLRVHVEEEEVAQLVAALRDVRAGLSSNASLNILTLTHWLYNCGYTEGPNGEALVKQMPLRKAMRMLEEEAARHPTCTLRLKTHFIG
jgi:hypothetical protein